MPAAARPRLAPLRNDVVLAGVAQRPESFAAAILSGFSTAYRFCLETRAALVEPDGPLLLFAGRRGRILFRPSAQYGLFLDALRAPRYQRRGLDRSIALEMMNRVFAPEETRPRLWPLVAEERDALEALDVPHYLLPVTESVITAGSGEVVGGHLVRSGLDAVADGLRAMTEDDLARQLDLLASALDEGPRVTVAPRPAAATEMVSGPALWMRGAATLGERILDRARGRTGFDLYRGQAGIALFLAALAAVTKDDRFRAAALDALRPLRARPGDHGPAAPATWPSVGACSGSGSVVYALATAGRLLDDAETTDAALAWARAIDPARTEDDPHCDVAGGTAGLLLALLALDDAGAPAWLRERIAACARRLVRAQVATANGGAWPGAGGRPLPGFAHGAAGIAYALARAYAITGEASVAEAVRRAHRYERSVFSAAARNWPAVHDGGTVVMTAWCHGAPGIGLARALGLDAFRDAEIEGEIAVAMATTTEAPAGRADHLCCGVMGRSEALLVMGSRLGDAAAIAAAQEMATRVAIAAATDGGRAIRTEGFEHRTFQPGFFRGLAGIGYQLLRTAEPARLPSVLGFERIAKEAP